LICLRVGKWRLLKQTAGGVVTVTKSGVVGGSSISGLDGTYVYRGGRRWLDRRFICRQFDSSC